MHGNDYIPDPWKMVYVASMQEMESMDLVEREWDLQTASSDFYI